MCVDEVINDATDEVRPPHIRQSRVVLGVFLLAFLLTGYLPLAHGTGNEIVQVGDATFSAEYAAGTGTLPIMGTGVLKYGGLIKVYAAALYHPMDTEQDRLLDPAVPKRLELAYFVSLDRKKFIEAAEVILERQHGTIGLARLRSSLDKLHSMLVDVTSGDRYSITHLPGKGLMLEHNNKVAGIIPDLSLSTAYFGIWLGDPPISTGLKEDLVY